MAAGQIIAGAFATEAGTAISHPAAEVVRDGDGFVLNGRKIFGTLSPVATVYFSPARMKGEDGEYQAVMTMMGKGMAGIEIKDNWDAMGMRASGSGDVVYTDVRLPSGSVIAGGNALGARDAAAAEMGAVANAGLIAAFAGIAEAASVIAIDLAKTRRKGPSDRTMAERHWMQTLVGEMTVDLET